MTLCGHKKKPAPGRYDPENPAVIKLAAEYGVTPGEYLADDTLHSGKERAQSNTLDTTIDEWREEIGRIEEGDPGRTLPELCEGLKVPRTTMQGRLKKLRENGRCIVGVGRRFGVNGVPYQVTVYQLKTKENANALDA